MPSFTIATFSLDLQMHVVTPHEIIVPCWSVHDVRYIWAHLVDACCGVGDGYVHSRCDCRLVKDEKVQIEDHTTRNCTSKGRVRSPLLHNVRRSTMIVSVVTSATSARRYTWILCAALSCTCAVLFEIRGTAGSRS